MVELGFKSRQPEYRANGLSHDHFLAQIGTLTVQLALESLRDIRVSLL